MEKDNPKRDFRAESSFDQRLQAAQRRAGTVENGDSNAQGGGNQSASVSPFGLAMRMGTEMVAALAIAVAIGYGLDRLMGTKPLFMVLFVPIGAAAGILNLIKSAGASRTGGSEAE